MITRLLKSRLVRNVFLVATGKSLALIITFAFSPILTRLYGPEAFGVLGTFTASLAIATPIAALAYPIAIVLPPTDDDARALARLSLLIALCISAVFAVVVLIGGENLSAALGLSALQSCVVLLPLAMFLAVVQDVMQQWAIRKKLFSLSARVSISQALLLNLAKLGAGLVLPLGATLITITTCGAALYAAQLWYAMVKAASPSERILLGKFGHSAFVKSVARKFIDFPLYRAPQITINAFGQSLPVLMLMSLSGPAAAGFYSLSRSVLGVPVNLLGSSVGSVFYPRINEAIHNKENAFLLVLKATALLAAAGFAPFLIIAIFAPSLFSIAFGEEWTGAGEFARWLAVWLYFMLMNSPSNQTLPVLRRQGFYLIFSISTTCIRALALYLGYSIFNSDLAAVAIFSISGAVTNVALIVFVLYFCYRLPRKEAVS